MNRYLAIVAGLCLLLGTVVASAQDDVEMYETEAFTLRYPADWEVVNDAETSGAIFSIPIEGQGSGGEDIVIEREDVRALFSLETRDDGSALGFARSMAEGMTEDTDSRLGLALSFTINDRDAAYVDVIGMFTFRHIVIVLDEETYLQVLLTGVVEQFVEVMPTMFDVLNTVRLSGDDTPIEETVVEYDLAQTHVRKGRWSFRYPVDWSSEEGDAFTQLTVPSLQTTIATSVLRRPNADDLEFWAQTVQDNVMGNLPETAEASISEFELSEFEALRLTIVIPQENIRFTQLFVHPEDEVVVLLSIIGPPQEVEMLLPVAAAIADTVEIADP